MLRKHFISTLFAANATFLSNYVQEDKWNGLHSSKVGRKMFRLRPKHISFPAPWFSPSLLEQGVTMETQRALSLLVATMKSEWRGKVETRCCRGWYFFLLFLLSPLSLLSILSTARFIFSALWFLVLWLRQRLAALTDPNIMSTWIYATVINCM